jgi:hypothetical protein
MNNPPVFVHDPPLGEGFITLWTCRGQPETKRRKMWFLLNELTVDAMVFTEERDRQIQNQFKQNLSKMIRKLTGSRENYISL